MFRGVALATAALLCSCIVGTTQTKKGMHIRGYNYFYCNNYNYDVDSSLFIAAQPKLVD